MAAGANLIDHILCWNLRQVKQDLHRVRYEASIRGLKHCTKWAAELSVCLADVRCSEKSILQDGLDDQFILAKAYFDLNEYDRCAFVLKESKSEESRFLYWYSRYLAYEKKRLDDQVEPNSASDPGDQRELKNLRREFDEQYSNLDGYCLYLYGVVLKKLGLDKKASEILLESVEKEPLNWSAWQELIGCITDRDMLKTLNLPNHWVKQFFLAHAYVALLLNDEALDAFHWLQQNGFSTCLEIIAKIAIIHHNLRLIEDAVSGFEVVRKRDPCRLDDMDIYSNLLYVKGDRPNLSVLAHAVSAIDKYRMETCCVIGNYYSLRSQHEKAVVYFQRALKLSPLYYPAWTLMGHEYIEMKNHNAAVYAYRQAIQVSRRDYRAWYGLGQTYELLKMPQYSLYYYRKAQQLRPTDSRMIVAVGDAYVRLEMFAEAKKCFQKAHGVYDIEGTALFKLAKVHEKLGEEEQAMVAFCDYFKESESRDIIDRDQQCQAHLFMARYYLRNNKLDEALGHAENCRDFAETKEEAKIVLKEIADKRAGLDVSAVTSAGSGATATPKTTTALSSSTPNTNNNSGGGSSFNESSLNQSVSMEIQEDDVQD